MHNIDIKSLKIAKLFKDVSEEIVKEGIKLTNVRFNDAEKKVKTNFAASENNDDKHELSFDCPSILSIDFDLTKKIIEDIKSKI